jgi:U3 small nucleolar RNA-associated protein 21
MAVSGISFGYILSLYQLELESTIQFDRGFTATSILHPATYVNKILVASNQGNMQLWNIKTK